MTYALITDGFLVWMATIVLAIYQQRRNRD